MPHRDASWTSAAITRRIRNWPPKPCPPTTPSMVHWQRSGKEKISHKRHKKHKKERTVSSMFLFVLFVPFVANLLFSSRVPSNAVRTEVGILLESFTVLV